MRLLTAVVSVLLLTACGSGSPTDTKPVPVVLVPTTVTVTAGAGQQAVPGANLTVKLVVTVKDGSGQPVPGISVGFAVDSGGGSLQSASATTAADGTASPGDWKMGPTEARNVLSVTVGALPPVRILALGAMVPVTIPDLTVGSGGGTITVAKPGAPIDGLEIVVPAGAFAAGQTVGITYGSALGITVPAGVTIISPLLTFRTSDGGIAASPMLITIPVVVPAGTVPGILLRDAASGRQELLTTVSYSTTSVTAMTGHLNGALLMGSDGSFLASASKRRDAPALGIAGATGTAAVIALPEELLALDHDTGFRPGVDSWEFKPTATVVASNLSPAMVATEAWYYIAKKSASGPLWKKYQEADGVELSNRRGLRWASIATAQYAQLESAGRSVINMLGAQISPDSLTYPERVSISSFNAVRTSLTLAPGSPELGVLSNDDRTAGGVAVLVYRSTGNRLFAADPGDPSQTITLDFTSGKMAPVTLSGAPGTYKYLFASGFALISTAAALQTQWPAVADGTIGNGVFPTFKAQVGWGNGAADYAEIKDPVYVFDTADPVQLWADCVSCIGSARPTPLIPPGTALVAGMYVFYRASTQVGTWSALGTTQVIASSRSTPGTSDVGIAFGARNTNDPSAPSWIDWVSMKQTRLEATITPASPTADANTDVNLTLTVTGAPANLEYVWDFTDGTAQAITSTPAVTHKWTSGGNYVVKVTARDKTTRQPVAKASTTATIGGGILAWKFTTMNVAFTFEGPIENHGESFPRDSTRLVRMSNGGSQGGIRLVEQQFVPLGFPPRIAPEGLYLLEAASLTTATVNYPLNENTFASTVFRGASLTLDPSPRVYDWNVVRAIQITPEPYCKDDSESFLRTGTATSGRVTGLTVQYCWDRFAPPQPGFEFQFAKPRMTIATDVTFTGNTAQGTLTFTYLYWNVRTPPQKEIATINFVATRL